MQKIIALLIVVAGVAGGTILGLKLRAPGGDPGVGEKASATMDTGAAAADAGHGGGRKTHPAAPPAAQGHAGAEAQGGPAGGGGHAEGATGDRDYVKLARQIIVPVVHERETRALMLFDLALDVPSGAVERAYASEPRLRDAFLRELMDLSYAGAFLSTYTDDRVIAELRGRLRAAARRILGEDVSEVLILDILRQEL